MPIIKLTSIEFAEYGKPKTITETILLGTEQIIKVEEVEVKSGIFKLKCTKISSVGGMVITSYVSETIKEIEELLIKTTNKKQTK